MTSITIDIEPGELGPHMQALAPKQQAFVFALVETGGNATQAALAAGYGADSPTHDAKVNAARSRGYQLSHDEKVLKAIKEEAQKRLAGGGLIAASLVLEIAQNHNHKGQMKALQMLLDRSGLQVKDEININVQHSSADVKRIIADIVSIARGVGVDPVALLKAQGVNGEIIDGEFVVVTDATPQPALMLRGPTESVPVPEHTGDPFYVPPRS